MSDIGTRTRTRSAVSRTPAVSQTPLEATPPPASDIVKTDPADTAPPLNSTTDALVMPEPSPLPSPALPSPAPPSPALPSAAKAALPSPALPSAAKAALPSMGRRRTPEDESRHDRFRRLGVSRTRYALQAIRLIEQLATPGYEYTEDEVETIFSAIETRTEQAKQKFQSRSKIKAEDQFQLSA